MTIFTSAPRRVRALVLVPASCGGQHGLVRLVFGESGDVDRVKGGVGVGQGTVGVVHAVQVGALFAAIGVASAPFGPLGGLAGRHAQPHRAIGGPAGE